MLAPSNVSSSSSLGGGINNLALMKSYENTFIRGPSPSFSDEVISENANSTSFPGLGITGAEQMQSNPKNIRNGKCMYGPAIDASIPYGSTYTNLPLSKGRKTFAFWTVVTFLLVLTIGNLILTLTIIGVLRLGKGIQGMELIPEEDVIKFYGSVDLDHIYRKINGQIDGFTNIPVTITGDENSVYIKLQRNGQSHNRIILDRTGINFKSINSFELKDPASGATIFTTHRPHYNIPKGADNLVAKSISASRLTSPIGHPLTLRADGRMYVKGSEGIRMDALSLLLQAEHNIVINSTHGGTVFEASSGIFLDMDKVPIVSSEFGIRTGSVQYKVCVCMPHGTLFRVAIPRSHNGAKISCAYFSADHDPCSIN